MLEPELEIRVEPSSIRAGESALLTWESRNADRVVIEPTIGSVDVSGRIKFFPEATTTYVVTAEGDGGRTSRSATVEVLGGLAPSSGVSEEDLQGLSPEERFEVFVKPVFFSFDSATLTDDAKLTLEGNIRWLRLPENRSLRFVLEGHADQRGSEEYNLALGDQRAKVVRDFLLAAGIGPERMEMVSLGEERPFETAETEAAFALNRRTQFVVLRGP